MVAFNHYVKIKRILETQPEGWTIRCIDERTKAKNFKGEIVDFTHYYRIYGVGGEPIKYCKFQQLERLAKILDLPAESLPILNQETTG